MREGAKIYWRARKLENRVVWGEDEEVRPRWIFGKLQREESGRIRAALIGLLGDFDLAEETLLQDYSAALRTWPPEGTPTNPRAWPVSTARHNALDRLRGDRHRPLEAIS
jgi:predicted RNA polymerase sigma factor